MPHEDMRTAKKYLASAKSGYLFVKGYLKSKDVWSSESVKTQSRIPPNDGIRDHLQGERNEQRQIRTEGSAPRSNAPNGTIESITLLPGWAVRRYVHDDQSKFDLHVNISGFASSQRYPQSATRAQRAFVRLAKGFAALQKLAETHHDKLSPPVSNSNSPQAPGAELKDEYSLEALDESFHRAHSMKLDGDLADLALDFDSIDSHHRDAVPLKPYRPDVSDTVLRWQANLESRVQLFWPNALSSRTISLELFVSPHRNSIDSQRRNEDEHNHRPIDKKRVTTLGDGTFQYYFVIKWDKICDHPLARNILSGEQVKEHELILHARLHPLASLPTSTSNEPIPDCNRAEARPAKLRITITHAPIRVISDIDDTIKQSNILSGARAVFRNVFVHDYEHTRIPGMSEWYTDMWNRGVRFHYVSNGPFQLLPVIMNFFHICKLPPGSVKLKSYAGRSLFNNLLTAPADRKRSGIVDILDSFPDSKFILIGDTGEQDLELYSQLAGKFPTQILAILLRDVDGDVDPIRDPTGKEWRAHTIQRSHSDPEPNSSSGSDSPSSPSSDANPNSGTNPTFFGTMRSRTTSILSGRSWTLPNSSSPTSPLSRSTSNQPPQPMSACQDATYPTFVLTPVPTSMSATAQYSHCTTQNLGVISESSSGCASVLSTSSATSTYTTTLTSSPSFSPLTPASSVPNTDYASPPELQSFSYPLSSSPPSTERSLSAAPDSGNVRDADGTTQVLHSHLSTATVGKGIGLSIATATAAVIGPASSSLASSIGQTASASTVTFQVNEQAQPIPRSRSPEPINIPNRNNRIPIPIPVAVCQPTFHRHSRGQTLDGPPSLVISAPPTARRNTLNISPCSPSPSPLSIPLLSSSPPHSTNASSILSVSVSTFTSSRLRSSVAEKEKEVERRRRIELQERVWRARAVVPKEVVLRVFREPRECVEVEDVLSGHGM
ncbi:hypothetical protein AX17_007552 [Amanita inopinata Kibby_2008]|nr:hypothetical protein AX17_007552 [Amanita inopinata Kibby_2008]